VTTADWRVRSRATLSFDRHHFPAAPLLRLVGLFIGDGSLSRSNHVVFHLRKPREITFLREAASAAGLEIREWGRRGETFAVPVGTQLRTLFADCYVDREKRIPPNILQLDVGSLRALYSGLLNSDG